jgi:hypothetical protein
LLSNLLCSASLDLNFSLRSRLCLAEQGTIGRGRLTVRFGFVPLGSKRVTALRNQIRRVKDVRGIKRGCRARARHGDHEPGEQMKGTAHGYPRATAGLPACLGGSEPEGASIGG